jgi:hypothetical protein
MSDYYLADDLARKRDRERKSSNANHADTPPKQAQDIKVTLLGDFLFSSSEPQGCDPYNSTQGKSPREAWRTRRDRR